MKRLAVSALIGAALLAGCGGGDDKPLSKADFIAKADKICSDANAQLEKLPQPKDPSGVTAYFGKAKPLFKSQVQKLKDIKGQAPSDIKDDYGKAMDVLDQQVDLIDDLIAAGSDQTKLQAVTGKLNTLDTQGNTLAKKIGLQKCGSSA